MGNIVNKPINHKNAIHKIRNLLKPGFNAAANSSDPNGLAPNVEVVTVDNTANWFPSDPLGDIFHFRGVGVEALGWRNHINFMNTPMKGLHSETDNSDMQGTVYFVKRFNDGDIACVVRVHPSIDTYGRDVSMLGKNCPELIDRNLLPQAHDYFESSRIIVDDKRLPRRLDDGGKNPARNRAAIEVLAASALYCNSKGIKGYFCFMPTAVWKVGFETMGFDIEPIGPKVMITDHDDTPEYEVLAAKMDFTDKVLEKVRATTGFTEDNLDYGRTPDETINQIMQHALAMQNSGALDVYGREGMTNE